MASANVLERVESALNNDDDLLLRQIYSLRYFVFREFHYDLILAKSNLGKIFLKNDKLCH